MNDDDDNDDLDEIDAQINAEGIEEMKELLEEEKAERARDKKQYRYGCPFCDFQSTYFNETTIHMSENQDCRKKMYATQQAYPILLYSKDGSIP
jgi:hypothetical protein